MFAVRILSGGPYQIMHKETLSQGLQRGGKVGKVKRDEAPESVLRNSTKVATNLKLVSTHRHTHRQTKETQRREKYETIITPKRGCLHAPIYTNTKVCKWFYCPFVFVFALVFGFALFSPHFWTRLVLCVFVCVGVLVLLWSHAV